MWRYLAFLFLIAVLAGCSSHWEHMSKRPSEFAADDRECQLLSGSPALTQEPGRGQWQSYENCMWERGWRKTNTIWFFDPGPK